MILKMRLREALLIISSAFTLTAFCPVKDKFTAAEQQQISIATPGLFDHSDAINIDFSAMKPSGYSFPLPVGKCTVRKNNSMEITTTEGDAVKCMFDGTVRLSRKHHELGYVIVVRHRNGLETVYGNNAQNLVEVGQSVKAGQTIAIVGTNNGVTYCDFSIMINGCRINPGTIISTKTHKLRSQTVLCERKGSLVNVSVVDDRPDIEESADDIDADVFEKSETFKLNLTKMENERWAYPLPGAKVISPYGGKRRHAGVDLKTKPNDEIVAAFDGVVTRSSPYFGYGNCIVLKHAYGLETLYSHQSKNLVKVGDKVKAGQIIGLTGRTGRATTEHLHFETHFKGRRFNPNLLFDHTNKKLQQATITLKKNGGISSSKN